MQFTEEMKLSLASGELIHQLGNLVAEAGGPVGTLTVKDGQVLQELGGALRKQIISDDYPALTAAGINPSKMTRAELVDVAANVINRTA
jgi:hypothetical protein